MPCAVVGCAESKASLHYIMLKDTIYLKLIGHLMSQNITEYEYWL